MRFDLSVPTTAKVPRAVVAAATPLTISAEVALTHDDERRPV